MKKKILGITALLLTAVLAMSACGEATQSPSKPAGTAASAATEVAANQTLNLLLGANVTTLDVNAVGWVTESQIVSQVNEGLFRAAIDKDGNEYYQKAGAKDYKISDDKLTYTFDLRDNKWSDGKPVTAQQYVDSYVRELTASNGFSNISNYNVVKNGKAFYKGGISADKLGVKAVNDRTLEITLEKPDLDALSKIASVYPIRKDVISAAKSKYGTNPSEMVFNGPFTVKEWTVDNKLSLKKNQSFWDAENVKLETVNMAYAAESGTQATLFDSKQLDIVEYNDDYAKTWQQQVSDGQITSVVQPKAMVRWVIFNQKGKSGLMTNKKVRLALSLAINRQEYLNTVFGGRYYPAWDFTPFPITVNGTTYNSKDSGTVKKQQAEYDTPEKLQKLLKEGLDEAGYKYSSLKDVVINYTDKSLNTQDQARIEYLKQTWEKTLGITIDVKVTSDFAYMQGDYDLTCATWNPDSPYAALRIFEKDSGIAVLTGNYKNDELQALFESTKGVTDPQKYIEIYRKIEDKLVGDAVVAPIYWGDTRYFQQTYVKGIQYRKLSAIYDFSRAYIAKH